MSTTARSSITPHSPTRTGFVGSVTSTRRRVAGAIAEELVVGDGEERERIVAVALTNRPHDHTVRVGQRRPIGT
jgi:hypothetical protein